jgi:AraC family transcriptional regulator
MSKAMVCPALSKNFEFSGFRARVALSMAANAITLSSGQFFGEEFRTVQTDSFVCAEGKAAGSEREVPRHRHASSHFVFVVRGTYITEARNQDRWYGPGTLIYNPTGTTHRDRFHTVGGRFLTITPSGTIARLLDARVPVSFVIHEPEAIQAAGRTRTQLLQGGGRFLPTLIEDCCLDLAGTISGAFETESRHVPSWLVSAKQIMRDCCTTGITVKAVASRLEVHPVHLARAFRRYFHISPSEYAGKCRISRARELLLSSRMALAEIAIEAGFSDQSHLTNAFRRETAVTPAAYRRLNRA